MTTICELIILIIRTELGWRVRYQISQLTHALIKIIWWPDHADTRICMWYNTTNIHTYITFSF